MADPIRTSPLLEWPAGQSMAVAVPCTLPAGRTLADWASFVLTVRADPGWPRSGPALAETLDPAGAGWPVALTAAGTPDQAATPLPTVTFSFPAPATPGRRRFALDVWGRGGAAGDVELVQSTWLTITPSCR